MNALLKTDIYTAALPSQVTDRGQTVDDGTGQLFKRDCNFEFTDYLLNFDWTSSPSGKLSAIEKRKLTSKIVDKVAGKFNEKHLAHVRAACMRTGVPQ